MTETNNDTYSEFKEDVRNNYAKYDVNLFPGYYSAKADYNGSTIFGSSIWPPETPGNYNNNERGKKYYGLFDVRYYCGWNTNDITIPAFTTTNILATLADKNGKPLTSMPVSYQINQKNEIKTTTDTQGRIIIPFISNSSGINTINVKYEGNKEYIPCTKTITVTVTKLTPTIQVNNVSGYLGAPATVSATLLQGSTPMVNKKLEITVQGTTYNVTTNSNGVATTPSFIKSTLGESTITVVYTPSTTTIGGVKDSDSYNSATKTATLTVVNKEKCSINITKMTSAHYNTTINIILTLKDKDGTPISNVKPSLKVNNTTVTVPNNTDSNGTTTIPYLVKSTGTLEIYASFSSNKYELASNSTRVPVDNIPTTLKEYPRTSSDGNDVLVILTDTISGDVLSNQQIKFYEGVNELDSSNTNSDGVARCNGAFFEIGTHNIRAEFKGTNVYAPSNTTFKLDATFLVDTCNDLRSWEVIPENWYASDGTAKWGVDENNINSGDQPRRCQKYEKNIPATIYKRNCSRVNEIPKSKGGDDDVALRNYCNDLKTEAYSENGLHAPTGVVLRNKYLKTTNNCTIEFKLMYKYNGINEKAGTLPRPVKRVFGGHFGLMEKNATTAENAPVRLEVYRRNSYCIIEGGNLTSNNFAYSFMENTWYTVQMHITSTKVTITILELNDSAVYTVQNKQFTGLYPYIFAFTNGTELVIREMKINPT